MLLSAARPAFPENQGWLLSNPDNTVWLWSNSGSWPARKVLSASVTPCQGLRGLTTWQGGKLNSGPWSGSLWQVGAQQAKCWEHWRAQPFSRESVLLCPTPHQSPARKAQRPKSLQLSDNRLTPFHGSSPPQSTPLSPPPLTPKATRTLSKFYMYVNTDTHTHTQREREI